MHSIQKVIAIFPNQHNTTLLVHFILFLLYIKGSHSTAKESGLWCPTIGKPFQSYIAQVLRQPSYKAALKPHSPSMAPHDSGAKELNTCSSGII